MICGLCKKKIEPARPAVELAGGLFDPQDPDFFVMDDSVLAVSYVHKDCLLKRLGER